MCVEERDRGKVGEERAVSVMEKRSSDEDGGRVSGDGGGGRRDGGREGECVEYIWVCYGLDHEGRERENTTLLSPPGK